MKTKVLVAYATTHGAMQEVAEFVTTVLREQGVNVDLSPARNVQSLQEYRAVVLGAPLYMFHWHKDAHRFLARHRKTLTGSLPVAIFAGGPFGETDADAWQEVRTRFQRELAQYSWLAPAAVEIVGGKFDPTRLRFPYNLIPAMKQMPPSDLRDWSAIRTWAVGLIAMLKLAEDSQPVTA